jgi:hypothetical protein
MPIRRDGRGRALQMLAQESTCGGRGYVLVHLSIVPCAPAEERYRTKGHWEGCSASGRRSRGGDRRTAAARSGTMQTRSLGAREFQFSPSLLAGIKEARAVDPGPTGANDDVLREQQKPGGLSCKLLQNQANRQRFFAQSEASAAQNPMFFGSIFELIQPRRHRISRLGSAPPGFCCSLL